MKKGLLIVTTIVISIAIILVGIFVLSSDRIKYEDYDYDIFYYNYKNLLYHNMFSLVK